MHKTLTIAKIRGVYVYVCACAGVFVFCPYMFMRTYAHIQIPHAFPFKYRMRMCFHSSSSMRNLSTPPATNNLPRPPFPSPRHKNWPPLKQSPPSLHHVLAQRPSRAPTHSSPTFRGYYLNLRRIYGTINECELSGWIPIRLIALTANA